MTAQGLQKRTSREVADAGLSATDLCTRAAEPPADDPQQLTDVLKLIAPFLEA